MGNWSVTIRGIGQHHNEKPQDVEVLAGEFVARLLRAGQNVLSAHVTTGGEIDLLPRLESVHSADYAVNLGKEAYEAYCQHAGWKSLATGADLPQWAGLRDDIRQAWMVSAAWIVGRVMRINGLQNSNLKPVAGLATGGSIPSDGYIPANVSSGDSSRIS